MADEWKEKRLVRNKGSCPALPWFVPLWMQRTRQDSNVQPSDSKSGTLSIELRAPVSATIPCTVSTDPRLSPELGRDVVRSCSEILVAKVKRLIYTGTIDSYYAGDPGNTITEDTPLDPHMRWRNYCAQPKALSEQLLMSLYSQQGLPVVILLDLAKWAIKRAIRHPDHRLPSYRDWVTQTQRSHYDCSKARKRLSWNPTVTRAEVIEKGIQLPASELLV